VVVGRDATIGLEGFSSGQWRRMEGKCMSWPQAAEYNIVTKKQTMKPPKRNNATGLELIE